MSTLRVSLLVAGLLHSAHVASAGEGSVDAFLVPPSAVPKVERSRETLTTYLPEAYDRWLALAAERVAYTVHWSDAWGLLPCSDVPIDIVASGSQVISATYADSGEGCNEGTSLSSANGDPRLLSPVDLFAVVERYAKEDPGCLWATFSAQFGVPERIEFDCAAVFDDESSLAITDFRVLK